MAFSGPLIFDVEDTQINLAWQDLAWDGVYNLNTGAYDQLSLNLQDISLSDGQETAEITVGQLALENQLADGTMQTTLTSNDILATLQVDSVTFTYTLPELSLNNETRGFKEGENPLINFGDQIAQVMGILDDENGPRPSIPLGKKGIFPFTAAPSTFTIEDFDRFTAEFGEITGQGRGTGYQTAGQGALTYTYNLSSFGYDDPASGLQVATGPLNASIQLSGFDFPYLAAMQPESDHLNDPAGGTYRDLGTQLLAGLAAQFQIDIRDVQVQDPDDGLDFSLAGYSLSMGFNPDSSGNDTGNDTGDADSQDGGNGPP